jgi:hypothetical protein
MEAIRKKAEDVLDDLKCPKYGKTFSTKKDLIEHGKTHVEDIAKDVKSKLNL